MYTPVDSTDPEERPSYCSCTLRMFLAVGWDVAEIPAGSTSRRGRCRCTGPCLLPDSAHTLEWCAARSPPFHGVARDRGVYPAAIFGNIDDRLCSTNRASFRPSHSRTCHRRTSPSGRCRGRFVISPPRAVRVKLPAGCPVRGVGDRIGRGAGGRARRPGIVLHFLRTVEDRHHGCARNDWLGRGLGEHRDRAAQRQQEGRDEEDRHLRTSVREWKSACRVSEVSDKEVTTRHSH